MKENFRASHTATSAGTGPSTLASTGMRKLSYPRSPIRKRSTPVEPEATLIILAKNGSNGSKIAV
jgi:hypothetical protein